MSSDWPSGPPDPHLENKDVHVWLAELAVPRERVEQYESLLAEDEWERAARFRFERHRNAYIAGRGMLRVLIGRYLKQQPESLVFSYSDFDKPFLAGNDLHFNLAHSGGLALYAFALQHDLGVDVEQERALSDALAISERFFSPAERAVLRELPAEEQIPAFFRCWSRKEAFIKAVGEGLSYPLADFNVTLAPGEPAQLLSIRGSVEEARLWTLVSVDLPPGYFGAVALQTTDVTLQVRRFVD